MGHASAHAGTPAPIRILLIEDNRGDALLFRHMLADAGALDWELAWARNLEEGIAHLRQDQVDLVLLDLGLPGSTGLETVQRLQSCGVRVPALVVLSGLNDEAVAMRAVQAGAQDYLVKGQVDTGMLVRSIRYAIERNQAEAALRQAHDMLEVRVAQRTAELASTVEALNAQIREREQAETLLRRREQEFRTLAENSPDMVIRYDSDCRRIYVNPAFERETGIPMAEALMRQPQKLVRTHADLAPEDYIAVLRRVMETGAGTEVFVRLADPGETARDYAFHLVPERNAEGQVVGVLAIGRNISALKETERRLSESQQMLRQLASRSDAVREEERKYITREIHDELGQYLSALRLGVSVVEMQFGADNPALAERTRALTGLVDSTIQVVRDVVSSLRPSALNMGIVSALEWLGEQFFSHTGVLCQLHVDERQVTLDEARATELFRIVQESLTNIRRHAGATRVDIALVQDDERIQLEVRDNGCGFDPAKRKRQSFGLLGIHERALKLGGAVTVDSKPGHGARIRVQIPAQVSEFPDK
ncbi:response regulator [Duganella sp. FT92W]|uniref:Response regulator n=1 Tax=Pseudoduganella rivuli TaxID=2666085 RepID=A0A7X2IQQ3_9BURK|nr:response regulator [Pseudoduganella rivuli]MRV74442.1 response regulator [Pseudoduganella rivuli]